MTSVQDDGGGALHLSLESQQVDLAAARQSLRAWASSCVRIPPALLANLELVSTELLTNAREASPNPDSPVRLRIDTTDNRVEVTVRSVGALFEPPLAAPSTADERGRGLAIVRSLSDDLAIRQVGNTVAVSAWFDLIETESDRSGS